MRIESDTTPYSGEQLGHSHHHHITKCLHEDKTAGLSGGAVGIQKDTYQAPLSSSAAERDMQREVLTSPLERSGKKRSGLDLVRGLWDSLGEEANQSAKERTSPVSLSILNQNGIKAAVSAVRQNFSHYIVNKWEAVREKIKVGTNSLLKRFGKKEEGFSMLSDAGYQTGGQRSKDEWKKDDERGTRSGREEIPSVYQDSHLMDSYSKKGEYCRLNENLTYQKGTGSRNHSSSHEEP